MDLVTVLLWAVAAASGGVAWAGRFELLPIALLVLLCWRWSRSRPEALGVGLAYYGAASFGLVHGASRFFGDATGWSSAGIAIWVGTTLLLSIPWAALWSRTFAMSAWSRVSRGILLGLVLLLPPVGLLSGVNPWVGGAAMMPGLGILGLLVVTASLLAPNRKTWPVWASALVLVSVLACRNYEPAESVNWAGVSTPHGALGHRSPTEQYDMAADAWQRALASDADVVLFPEGLGGTWTTSSESLWALEAEERDALWIVGAMRRDTEGQRNGVGIVGDGEPYFWSQRLPAPIGMWAPWANRHVKGDLFAPSVKVIQGRRTALLMCFEQFVGWPALQSALERAEVVLAPANLWFARGTNLNAVREVTLQSWARLMGRGGGDQWLRRSKRKGDFERRSRRSVSSAQKSFRCSVSM
jgi:hypothetical protein